MSKKQKAYKQGYDAYQTSPAVNPYHEGNELHYDWLEGYEDAMDEDQESEDE